MLTKLNIHCVKSHIWSFSGPYFPELGPNTEMLCISPYLGWMWELTGQKNSYGHFSRNDRFKECAKLVRVRSFSIIWLLKRRFMATFLNHQQYKKKRNWKKLFWNQFYLFNTQYWQISNKFIDTGKQF